MACQAALDSNCDGLCSCHQQLHAPVLPVQVYLGEPPAYGRLHHRDYAVAISSCMLLCCQYRYISENHPLTADGIRNW